MTPVILNGVEHNFKNKVFIGFCWLTGSFYPGLNLRRYASEQNIDQCGCPVQTTKKKRLDVLIGLAYSPYKSFHTC